MNNKLQTVTMQLDDDVWAECQRLGKEHGTINEGLRARLLQLNRLEAHVEELEAAWPSSEYPLPRPVKRGPRQKGDKTR